MLNITVLLSLTLRV